MIQQDIRQGQSIGVNSTPSVFINGVVQKDKRLEGFIETIEQELKALK
jgi:protein-disulfide isomerase